MSDIKLSPEGPRGARGHRGEEGPTGPTGPAGAAGGLLKFSGMLEGLVSYLPDAGSSGPDATSPLGYPVAIARSLQNLATNLAFVVPSANTVVIELLQNGVPVPGFTITYGPGDTGVKVAVAGPVMFAGAPVPDTLDLRATASFVSEVALPVSATIGIA